MNEYNDREIIECLRSRQSYVVRYLFHRYMPMIRLMVRQMGGTVEDAQDIFQEGLEIIINKVDDRDYKFTCSLKTYLYCVCKNKFGMDIEKRRAAANYFCRRLEDDSEKDIDEIIDEKLYEKIFSESFDTLDAASRKILRLYWNEVPPREIARQLNHTYQYVRKRKCIAQAELIRSVKDHPAFKKIRKSEDVIKGVVY
jgi:RNA polymerase sigma factor (sigma-70 family)